MLVPPPSVYQVMTVQLEWEKLSFHTGDPKYAECARRAMRSVRLVEPGDGLYPMFIHPSSGTAVPHDACQHRMLVGLCRPLLKGCERSACLRALCFLGCARVLI